MAGSEWKVFVLFQRGSIEKAGVFLTYLLNETQDRITRMLSCPEAKYPQILLYHVLVLWLRAVQYFSTLLYNNQYLKQCL